MASRYMRFVALILMCTYMLCAFANFNSPGSLQKSIIDNYKLKPYQYTVLYSMSTWASLLDMVHGYIMDRYLGLRWGTVLYVAIMMVGGILYSAAAFIGEYWLLLLSRFIFGFGSNPLMLCVNGYIQLWFGDGQEVNLAYSLQESMMWLGTSLLYFSSVQILSLARTKYNPFTSLALTIFSETIFLLFFMSCSMLILAFITPDKKKEDTVSVVQKEIKNAEPEKELSFIDYITFPPIFWFYAFSCFLIYFGVLSFISLSQVFFMTIYNVDVKQASELSGLMTLIMCLLSPLVGIILDKIGLNLTCLQLCQVMLIISQGFTAFGTIYSPIIPVIIMAIGLALSSSCWSLFITMAKDYQVLIAYGIAQTGLCLAVAVGSLVSGIVTDRYGYSGLSLFIFIVTLCALPTMMLVWILNYTKDNLLNKSKLVKALKDNKGHLNQQS